MTYQLISVALMSFASPATDGAAAIISAYDRDFCRAGASRSEGNEVGQAGLKLVSSDSKLGVTYAVDGPVEKNDVLNRYWEGTIQGGSATLWNIRIDYEVAPDQSLSELRLPDSAGISADLIEGNMQASFLPYKRLSGGDYSHRAVSPSVQLSFWLRNDDQTGEREWVISCKVSDS